MELDKLRPEVREDVEYLDAGGTARVAQGSWTRVRAELLRLAEDAAMFAHAVSLGQRYKQRTEKAEAELATAQNTIAAQQGTMGALKRKLALSEGELAALKARIAEAPWISFETLDEACEVGLVHGSTSDWLKSSGKRVRLLVEE